VIYACGRRWYVAVVLVMVVSVQVAVMQRSSQIYSEAGERSGVRKSVPLYPVEQNRYGIEPISSIAVSPR